MSVKHRMIIGVTAWSVMAWGCHKEATPDARQGTDMRAVSSEGEGAADLEGARGELLAALGCAPEEQTMQGCARCPEALREQGRVSKTRPVAEGVAAPVTFQRARISARHRDQEQVLALSRGCFDVPVREDEMTAALLVRGESGWELVALAESQLLDACEMLPSHGGLERALCVGEGPSAGMQSRREYLWAELNPPAQSSLPYYGQVKTLLVDSRVSVCGLEGAQQATCEADERRLNATITQASPRDLNGDGVVDLVFVYEAPEARGEAARQHVILQSREGFTNSEGGEDTWIPRAWSECEDCG